MRWHNYFVYITTNRHKTVLYIGVTNNLPQRITEHYMSRDKERTFTGKYNAHYLIYFERYEKISYAIKREKQLKGWLRKKKEALIETENPNWRFLNVEVCGMWPPKDEVMRSDLL